MLSKTKGFPIIPLISCYYINKSCGWLPITWAQRTLCNASCCCMLNLLGKFVTEEANINSVYSNFLDQGLLPEKTQALLQFWGAIVACASWHNCLILNVRWKWVLLKQEKRILDQGSARSAHTLADIYICSAFWLLPCTPGNCLVGFILKETGKSHALQE